MYTTFCQSDIDMLIGKQSISEAFI